MSDELPSLAITGATGSVGGAVAQALSAAGLAQRLLLRNPARAPQLDGAVVLPCAYGDGQPPARALQGVQTLFMVSGAESADRLEQHRDFVDAATAAGVEHIVYTSFAAASPTATFTLGRDHYFTEEHIRRAGLSYTFLRDSFYLDFLTEMVGDDGVIRGPAADGRAAFVARADVARTAATVLQDPAAHVDATYQLTGPEALTLTEVASTLSRARGTEVTYHCETIPEAYASRQRWGAPDWQNDAWVSTYTAIAAGELAEVSPDVERVTGRRPLSLQDVLLGRG